MAGARHAGYGVVRQYTALGDVFCRYAHHITIKQYLPRVSRLLDLYPFMHPLKISRQQPLRASLRLYMHHWALRILCRRVVLRNEGSGYLCALLSPPAFPSAAMSLL